MAQPFVPYEYIQESYRMLRSTLAMVIPMMKQQQCITCNELATHLETTVSFLALDQDNYQYLATNYTKYIKQHSYTSPSVTG